MHKRVEIPTYNRREVQILERRADGIRMFRRTMVGGTVRGYTASVRDVRNTGRGLLRANGGPARFIAYCHRLGRAYMEVAS